VTPAPTSRRISRYKKPFSKLAISGKLQDQIITSWVRMREEEKREKEKK
jgi:hypothetical protein